MAKPNYEFIGEESRGILRIILRNHWDLSIVDQFREEEATWWNKICLDSAHNPYRYLLIDASDHGVQSQETVSALRTHIDNRRKIFERTAIVISGVLHQMQAGRVRSNSDDHRLCGSMEEALAWLNQDKETRASAA